MLGVGRLIPVEMMRQKQKITNYNAVPRGAKMIFRAGGAVFCLYAAAMLMAGCSHFRARHQAERVYVLPKEKMLKDHVAALAKTTATVTNGQPLEVIERSKRFIHVKTEKGETGWIEEATVVTQPVADEFTDMATQSKSATALATATASAESRMHVRPGRTTTWLYLIERDEKVQLLKRAIALKPVTPGAAVSKASSESGEGKENAAAAPPMEDWWLVRDQRGRTGWVLSRSLDIDVPDAMLKLGQGERFMAVYPLNTVHDDDSGQPTGSEVTQYVVGYAANHSGMMYDFDTVVVYTWNTKKHRYEGAYRDRDIEGFLPLTVTQELPPVPANKKPAMVKPVLEPFFRYKLAPVGATVALPDPDAKGTKSTDVGVPKPSALLEKTFRLEGERVIAVGVISKPSEEAHPVPEKKSEKKGGRKK
jgi:hypothetical protein